MRNDLGVKIERDVPAPPPRIRRITYGKDDRFIRADTISDTIILYYERAAARCERESNLRATVGGDLAMSPNDAQAFGEALIELAEAARGARR